MTHKEQKQSGNSRQVNKQITNFSSLFAKLFIEPKITFNAAFSECYIFLPE